MTEHATGWSTTHIAGKPADLYLPSRWSEPRTVMLYLHGHALITLKDNPVYTAQLERLGWGCLCPSGARSWWVDRICTEFDPEVTAHQYLLQSVLPWIESQFDLRPPGIPLCGVSMGGQAVLRLSYFKPQDFPVVAALAPAIDYHQWYGQGLPLDQIYPSQEAARQDTALLALNPLRVPRQQLIVCDPEDHEGIGSAEKLISKMSSSGVRYVSDLETRRGGHTWDYFNAMAEKVMTFLAAGMESERRRLPIREPS